MTATNWRTVTVATPAALDARLDTDGYAYLDDDGAVIDAPPRLGWFVSYRSDGTPTALRLTDSDTDPEVRDGTATVRTDHEPALFDRGECNV